MSFDWSTIEPWVVAYVVAGIAYYLKLLRAAWVAKGYFGNVMRHGLTRASFLLVLGTVLLWPVGAWRGRRRSIFEVAVFTVAGVIGMLVSA